jgi:hypothetical protein
MYEGRVTHVHHPTTLLFQTAQARTVVHVGFIGTAIEQLYIYVNIWACNSKRGEITRKITRIGKKKKKEQK